METKPSNTWWNLSAVDSLAKLGVDAAAGLGEEEAGRRLAEYGSNALVGKAIKSPWAIPWEQLTGESEPVGKTTEMPGNAEASLGDRLNMAYTGTRSGLSVASFMKSDAKVSQKEV